jgi:hypothetical protein
MSVVLQPAARQLFNSYRADVARANGVESAKETLRFCLPQHKKLSKPINNKPTFLKLINIWPVDNGKGEKIALSIGTTIAGNTNTNVQPRQPTAVGNLDLLDEYDCTQTNYDVAMKWLLLNAWRHFLTLRKSFRKW